MKRFLGAPILGALFILLISTVSWAQLSTAQLSGKVTDSTGAILPGVTVTVTQTDTGLMRTVVTDGDGTYLLSNLPTGPYRLEATLSGFRTYAQTGIVLQVAANAVANAVLQLGELAETVSVEASTPLVDVKSAGISEVVENERIVELPLQGRQVTNLIVLAGAAVDTTTSNPRNLPGAVSIGVAGGLAFGVAYLLDGAMHNDPSGNLNLPLPFPDALQEFSVATSGLSAQNGMHSGASVNAITKSGTNRFSGNAFDFLRHKRFNATNPFSQVGPDGTRLDDGLKRNQFGGTIGGPLITNKLFFFGAYQGTRTRQIPAANIAYVPSAAMLAGDFTTFASAACNAGRAVALRAPFVNNRIDPALFSPAAVNVAKLLPATADPCGQIKYTQATNVNEDQTIGKVDYQWNANHSMFGRYMATLGSEPSAFGAGASDNVLTTQKVARDTQAHAFVFGDTFVFGPSVVNSLRVTNNRSNIDIYQEPFFATRDVGVKVYNYIPKAIVLTVTGAFGISSGNASKGKLNTNATQISDDLTLVRGRHQMAFGASVAYWDFYQELNARANGDFTFNGGTTGLALADFLTGNLFRLEHGAPGILPLTQTYLGVYGQDAWRLSNRVTLNAGLRWEPYFGQAVTNGSLSIFDVDNFHNGVHSTVFTNAPAGLIYPGDKGFPAGKSGMNVQWWNLSPRLGLAWDVRGDGRIAVRSSYGLAYDFPTAQYHYINASAAPFANRLRVEGVSFDDPYRNVPGGDTHPIPPNPPANAPFPAFGSFGTIDPDINSPRVQSWNVTVEQQIGAAWSASVSYLGSYYDRLWGQVALSPGRYLGLGPCAINGVSYPVCTTAANLDQRRVFYSENPKEAQFLGPVDRHTDIGTQDYRGLKLSFRRRATTGVSLAGNYTVSHCVGNTTPGGFPQISAGYLKPEDPDFDRGNCSQNRTHIGNISVGAQTPTFSNAALHAVASDWRLSGIFSARSGSWLSITTARDIAFTGIQGQRLNQLLDDPYGDKSVNNYLNPAAFAYPASGTLGNSKINSVAGPEFFSVDLSLSRLIPIGSPTHNLEFRVEAFNLLNRFNYGNPVVSYDSAAFGRIQTMSGDPRLMQFAIKYAF